CALGDGPRRQRRRRSRQSPSAGACLLEGLKAAIFCGIADGGDGERAVGDPAERESIAGARTGVDIAADRRTRPQLQPIGAAAECDGVFLAIDRCGADDCTGIDDVEVLSDDTGATSAGGAFNAIPYPFA